MNVRERIFDLVFPDRRRTRRKAAPEDRARRRPARKERTGESDGYDPRYFIRHRH